ncbi:MAG TPA: glutamate racemase [Gammaproteobacteria bacterium]
MTDTSAAAPVNLPIGIFDSGVGGLTVLRALQAVLPHENFLYLGDTARVPYGTRSPETVRRYARQASALLFSRGIKALVVACNTASAAALDALRGDHPETLIEGVIEPGARAAHVATRVAHVAVIATEGTVAGGAYPRALAILNQSLRVEQRACPLLVALAEEGWTNGPVVDGVLQRYLDGLFPPDGADVLVLGCTHFPVLADAIRAAVPPSVRLVDSAATTATVVAEDLAARGLRRMQGGSNVHFLVTDNPGRFERTAANFLGAAPAHGAIELVDINDASLPGRP